MAVSLAMKFNGEIISADSRQFYMEMKIGTARPDEEMLSKVKHHFTGFISVSQNYNASTFENDALKVVDELFEAGKCPIVTGGSGLYMDAIVRGFDLLPDVDREIRDELNERLKKEGLEILQNELLHIDPVSYISIDVQNPRRLIRALEVYYQTGKPYSEFLRKDKGKKDFKVVKIGLSLPLEKLYQRIEIRCRQMLEQGLLTEVENLMPYRHLPPLQTIGYREFFNYLEGKATLDSSIAKFIQHSRNYARKQLSWLRRDLEINWFDANDTEAVSSFVSSELKSF